MKINQNLVQKAWKFAAEKHANQLYFGTNLPYIHHIGATVLELSYALEIEYSTECLDIAAKLFDSKKNLFRHQTNGIVDHSFAMICAILHDVLEDTETTFSEVESEFGKYVATSVQALTKKKDSSMTKREQMLDSLNRILLQPKEIWMVKLSDRIANLSNSPPKEWSDKKRIQYIEESEIIHESLHSASSVLDERLKMKIAEWKKLIKH